MTEAQVNPEPTDPALADGWEPDAPVGDTLVRQFVFAYADRTAAMARGVGGTSQRDDDAALADLESPFRYDNAVVLLRPPSADSLIDIVRRAYAFFPDRRSWVLLSVWPTPDLAGLGLTREGHPPLMFRPPGEGPANVPADLRIEPVRTQAQLDDFRHVLVEGYPLADGTGAFAALSTVEDLLALFVGYVDGTPVSVAGAARNHGVVEVDWVATLPAYRGWGYGQALTAAAMAIAPEPAVLISSDDGRGVYERLGFVSLLRTTVWARTPDWSHPL